MKKQCSAPGCAHPERYRQRGLCGMHYQRLWKHGAVDARDHRLDRRPVSERFWEKVAQRGASECWPWLAGTVRGYGYLQRGGRRGGRVLAHRLSWEIHRGPVPDGLLVLHACDNPPCVNPAHLFLGTQGDNHADMTAKGRGYSTFREHPEITRGEANNHAKLNADQVREIRRLAAAGWSRPSIARRFGVTRQNVRCIVTGQTWRHVA